MAPTAAAVPAAGTDREADRAAAAAARAEAAAAALAAGEHVQCECGLVAVGRVSSTRKNPGRRFYACPKQEERSRCDYLSGATMWSAAVRSSAANSSSSSRRAMRSEVVCARCGEHTAVVGPCWGSVLCHSTGTQLSQL